MRAESDEYFDLLQVPRKAEFQVKESLRGLENVGDTFRLLRMNLHLHKIDQRYLQLADTLGPAGAQPQFKNADLILTNPPPLRQLIMGHYGWWNLWLAAAPQAEIIHGLTACHVSLQDLADRPPRALADGETIDIGTRRIRYIDTPHVPHGWEAGVLFEETTRTLLCGDLFTHTGNGAALVDTDIVGPAIAAEDMFHATALTPSTASSIRKLADLKPTTLAVMHGSSYRGDGATALRSLAAYYEKALDSQIRRQEAA